MSAALQFWLVVEVIGLLAVPCCALLFGRLPGGGFALAKPLGLLLASYPAWLLAGLHVLRYGGASIALGIALLGLTGAVAWLRVPGARPTGGALRLWLAAEVLFGIAFCGWALLHGFSPDVWQTEKPMDMAIVGSIQRSHSFPPPDPWFSGDTLNYYYYGHYLVAWLSRTAHVGATAGFNLGVALFYALSAVSVFGVASALHLAARRDGGVPSRSPALVGLAAVAFAVVAGNIAGGVDYLRHPGSWLTYDWFAPSRVIAHTANEFPSFSFLLADLHAHVMAAPFALLVLAYSLQLCLAGPPGARTRAAAELLIAGLALGSLYAINSFDYPTAVALGALALILWTLSPLGRIRGAAAWLAAWLATSILVFLPFALRFSPTTGGIGLVREHPSFSRFGLDELLIYGLPLWVVLTLLMHRLRMSFRYAAWATVGAAFVLTLLSPRHLAGVTLALVLAALALHTALSSRFPQPQRFLWLLTAAALGLIALGEYAYVRDSFDGTASYRFNTVFKAGYQAWFLLAVAAGCIVFWNRAWLGRRTRAAWTAGLVVLAVLAAAYPIVGSYSRTGGFSATPSLDGLRWLERRAPGDVRAIAWLRKHVRGTPTVLEAFGPDFSPRGHARISTFTGLPTVLGWGGHEVQWGHDPGGRGDDVARLYSTSSVREGGRLLARYRIRFVVIGSLERADYPSRGLAKFSRLGRRVFTDAGTVVFAITPTPPRARTSAP